MEPACDIQCQRNKKLGVLLTELQKAAVNKTKDPQGYENARMKYYTLKEGQGWLHTEKEKIAQKALKSTVAGYEKRYQAIAIENARKQAIDDAKAAEVGDEDEVRFLRSQIEHEKDKAGVNSRMFELTSGSSINDNWYPIFLDVLIAFFSLWIVYLLFGAGKFMKIKEYVMPTNTL
jgi:hypothetical protein